jgi:hypothetical protein
VIRLNNEFAWHYGCNVIPTRVYSPRDKGLVANLKADVSKDK